jgi:hypothetical protein
MACSTLVLSTPLAAKETLITVNAVTMFPNVTTVVMMQIPRTTKAKGSRDQWARGASIQVHEIPPDSLELEDSRTPTSPPAFNPSHEKQDVYPPSRKRAVDQHVPQQEEYNPAILAARAIKTAVLHDARNIKGDDDHLSELRFGVNSAHEAKVQWDFIYAEV